MVQAAFFIGNDPETAYDEAAARAALADDRAPESEGGLEGRIDLSGGSGAQVQITDDLVFLMPALCLDAWPRLEADGRVTIRMASWPSSIELLKEGGDVLVLDARGQETGRFPAPALKDALLACARRFADYLREAALLDDGWGPVEQALAKRLQAPV